MKKNYASALVDIIERLMLETSAANVPLLTENDVVLVGVGGIAGEYNGCEQGLVRTKNPDKSWKISDPLLYHFSGNVVPGGFRIIFNDDPVLSERITQAAVDLKKNETALYLDAVRELSKGKQVKRIVWEGDLDFSNPEDVEDYIKRQQEKKPVAEHALEDYINGHLERLEKTIIPKLQENLGFRKVYQVLELEDIAAGSVQKALQESKIPYLVAVPRRWPANQNED
ncbi:MAG: hypothetical protein QXH80_01480 [Candidatus Nanoarchaeia archaeon]